jgi:branched-chain amino acid transport system ATP-binding protein
MNVVMGISDIIVVFDSGEVIARGLPQEIRENKEVIKAYLGEEYIYA